MSRGSVVGVACTKLLQCDYPVMLRDILVTTCYWCWITEHVVQQLHKLSVSLNNYLEIRIKIAALNYGNW